MRKKIEMVLAVLLLIAIAITVFVLMLKDTKAPEITFTEVPVYYEGDDDSVLLQGVKATDNKDGDVSDSVVIDHVMTNPDSNIVTVYYAAKDSANNVTKASRQITCQKIILPEDATDGAVDQDDENFSDQDDENR